MSGTSSAHRESVVGYYNDTRWDYQRLWSSNRTLALHFGYFDQQVRGHRQSLLRMNQVLADRVGAVRADRVVDLGCGMGGSAIWLAGSTGCEVTGVNITSYQLEIARSAAGRAGVGALVRFELADFADTGLPGGAYTMVWALESLVHAERKQDVLTEAFRLLAPGGRLLIAEYVLCDRASADAADRDLLAAWCGGWAMPGLLSESQYTEMLQRIGFTGIEMDDITEHVAPSLARIGRIAGGVRPVVGPLHRLGLLTRRQVANAQGSRAQVLALKRGLWRYQVILARRPS